MQIEELDQMPAAEATAVLRSCADVPRWAEEVVTGRPYGERDALLLAADRAAATWTADEVDAALADHPRIGERHQGDGASAAHSAAEQSAVSDTSGSDVRQRLLEGNLAYEVRFGRIFLVRAAGRDAEEILAQLEQRLGHDDATEHVVVKDQLREIAALRLAGMVEA